MTEQERSYYTEHIKQRLTEWRFKHSVNVSKEAVRLANKYGCDADKAEFAGLLHDVMKDAGKKEQLELINKYGAKLNYVEKSEPKLWHAIAGAVYLEKALSVTDFDIINAVRYHTTGRAGMSLLEKIIYIADYTSAERDYDGVDEMRKACDISLEKAMEEALVFTIQKEARNRKAIEPHTFEAYNEIVLAANYKK